MQNVTRFPGIIVNKPKPPIMHITNNCFGPSELLDASKVRIITSPKVISDWTSVIDNLFSSIFNPEGKIVEDAQFESSRVVGVN